VTDCLFTGPHVQCSHALTAVFITLLPAAHCLYKLTNSPRCGT
jgi:hypothetical protein